MPPPVRVLHVDDDAEFAELAASFLERVDDGVEVVTETSAEDALERLVTDGDLDCVVADYDMASYNGLEFLRDVREAYPDLPFILFTGKGSEEIAAQAISEGVTDYLQKGSGVDRFTVLANRIRNAVAKHRAEASMEATERRLAEIADRSNDILWMFDADWSEALFINSAYEDIWGRSIEALRGEPLDFLEGIHPDDRGTVRDAMERLTGGDPVELEYRVNADEDFGRWVWVNAEPVHEGGEVVRIVGFARDVTDRRERERRLEALHASTRRLLTAETKEELAELASEAVRDTLEYPFNVVRLREGDGLVPVVVSDEMELTLGGERPTYAIGEETAGLAFERGETIVYDDVRELADDYDRGATASSMYVPIGRHGVVSISDAEPGAFDEADVHLAEVLVANVESVMTLIDEREVLARQNERLDAFASVVSHDLRNPLSVAMGRLELARQEVAHKDLEEVVQALDRMDDLIGDVLTLAQRGEGAAEPTDVPIAEAVEDAWQMAAESGDLEVEDGLGWLRGDASLLRQLLENLFRNAVEHAGPDVTVRVGALGADDVESREGLPGPRLRGFYVEDDGPGIPAEVDDSAFDAGVSTTEDGAGLGLSIVREIAAVHGWSVAAVGSDGGGTRIEVTGLVGTD